MLSIAYAVVLSLGTLAFEEEALAALVMDKQYSLFRLGLRVWDALAFRLPTQLAHLTFLFLVLLDPSPPASLKTVGG